MKNIIDKLGKCLATAGITIAAIALIFQLFSGAPPASTDEWFIIGFITATIGGMTLALDPIIRGVIDLLLLHRNRR